MASESGVGGWTGGFGKMTDGYSRWKERGTEEERGERKGWTVLCAPLKGRGFLLPSHLTGGDAHLGFQN